METNEKIERLLDMIEHPEHYTEEEMQKILADKETREYDDLIIKADDAYTKRHDIDVDKALKEFETKHLQHFSWSKIAAIFIGILLVSGVAYAAIVLNKNPSEKQAKQKAQIDRVITDKAAKSIDTETTDADTTTTQKGQSFDNVELQTILDNISSYYKLNVVYNSDKSKHLRLHFYWDKSKDAETIVESLNHFENVNITLTDNKMKRYILFLIASLVAISVSAQRITHDFRDVSMSKALKIIEANTSKYKINFIYNELEDFTVTTSIDKKSVPDAIRDVIGFYPIKMTVDGDNIFVECVQKENTKLIGEVVDKKGQPIVYANISLLSAKDSTFINGGVSNLAGKFVIPCGAKHALVKISCIGYKTILKPFDAGDIYNPKIQFSAISETKRSKIGLKGKTKRRQNVLHTIHINA